MQRARAWGIRETDVFDCHPYDPARDIKRIFPGLEHAPQPIKGCVGVAVANRFVKRGDEVVMALSCFVIEQDTLLHSLLHDFPCDA
jgi:hypothetical protein